MPAGTGRSSVKDMKLSFHAMSIGPSEESPLGDVGPATPSRCSRSRLKLRRYAHFALR